MRIFNDAQIKADAERVKHSLEVAGVVTEQAPELTRENESESVTDIAADATEFSYGIVDRRGLQMGEVIAQVPQGSGFVDIYYNPATRDARPIPVEADSK